MTEAASMGSRVLYLMVCAAPPAQQTLHVATQLQEAGWIDRSALEARTGHLVRTDYKLPGEADHFPRRM